MSGRDYRVVVEVLTAAGRRPTEICQLTRDCLRTDTEGGRAVLRDNFKG